jgi:hypothetical protein
MTDVRFWEIPAARVQDGSHVCNTCNLWPGGARPWNYDAVCSLYDYSRWAFVDVPEQAGVLARPKPVPLDLGDCKWAQDLAAQYAAYGRWTSAMQDAVDWAVHRDHGVTDVLLAHAPFVRGEACSLKYGVPCRSSWFSALPELLRALITAPPDHTPLTPRTTLWCVPWVAIQDEFRVFVHNYTTTAMSQQAWYKARAPDQVLSEALVRRVALGAEALVTAAGLGSAVVDVGVLDSGDVYVIEANPFGARFSSGSSLFEWRRDASTLTGLDSGGISVATCVE